MRSSVSVILSSPVAETSMSHPDYSAHPNHHLALLLLVRPVGTQKCRSFNKLFERINKVNHVKVTDSSGNQRPVWVTYRKEYSVDNNEWGDFQTHRRVLGIVTIGEVGSQADMNVVCNEHENLKSKYASTVYDSRCIILGVNADRSVHVPSPHPTPSAKVSHESVQSDDTPFVNDRDSGVYETHNSLGKTVSNPSSEAAVSNPDKKSCKAGSDSGSESTTDFDADDLENRRPSTASSDPETDRSISEEPIVLEPPPAFKTRVLYYPTGEHATNIESQIQEFIGYLFWVLEYKRMDKAKEKQDKPQILCAPFERKDFVGLDLDSRTNKKRCLGRIKKHLADLSLQAGLIAESLSLYTQAADILKSSNDWLWLAACYEGLCAASALTLYPDMYQRHSLQRYASCGMVRPQNTEAGGTPRHIGTNSLPSGMTAATAKQVSKFCLSAEDMIDRYKDVIVHYSRFRNASVVETEASIKAVHVLIEQKQYLIAAEFLNNVVFINLLLPDDEKIVRFNRLADLYQQIGLGRKAAFFRRVAAMRCVAPQNPTPDWNRCHKLLLRTLTGYNLCLDLAQFTKDNQPGWPDLQIQLLHELKGTSQRMGESSLCSRHQAFLLSSMLSHMTDGEKQENFAVLDTLAQKNPSGSGQMVIPDSGIILPPVNFMNIPLCRMVKVLPLVEPHQVVLRTEVPIDCGPFIFSPFLSMSNEVKPPGKIDHLWVVGDVCEVVIYFQNTLHFPIKLTDVKLQTEGAEFESWTSTASLNGSTDLQSVSLHGRPRSAGELRVTGYSFVLAGVASSCKFKAISHLNVPHYFLDVLDAMPFVNVTCHAIKPTGTESTEDRSVNLSINAGETAECSIVIHNSSSEKVEEVDITLESSLDKVTQKQVFQYSIENLEDQLPIMPGGKATLTLYVYASADFLLPGYKPPLEDSMHNLIHSSEPSVTSEQLSLFSRNSNVMASFMKKRKQLSSSIASNSIVSLHSTSSCSAPESFSSVSNTSYQNVGLTCRNIDASVRVNYTGGTAKDTNYCRSAVVSIQAKVVPSLLVTRWDAIPSEMSHQCYVVLDLCNVSLHEMDLQYTAGKNILIQSGESCRVPVPVDRCPISKLERLNGEKATNNCEVLAEYIASSIDLQWELSPTETPGKAFLDSLPFPSQIHHLITMPPINWVVELNGEVTSGGEGNVGRLGEIQNLKAGWKNTSGKMLPPVTLQVSVFQDHQNGFSSVSLENKFSAIGATRVDVAQLSPDSTYIHECALIFYAPGIYKVELICSSMDQTSDPSDTISSFNKDKSLNDRAWKLAPPLEIIIEN